MCSDDTYAGSFGLLVYDIFIGHILTMHIGWHKRENGMDWNLKYIRQIYLILIGSIADLTMLWCHLQYGRRIYLMGIVGVTATVVLLLACLQLEKRDIYITDKINNLVLLFLLIFSTYWHCISNDRIRNAFLMMTLFTWLFSFATVKDSRVIIKRADDGSGNLMLAGVVSLLFGLLLFKAMLTSAEGSILYTFNSINKANLKDYVIVSTVILALFLLLGKALSNTKIPNVEFTSSLSKKIMISLIILILSMIQSFLNVPENFFESILYILIPIGLLIMGRNLTRNLKCGCCAIYVLTLIKVFVQYANINIWTGATDATVQYNVHHAGAYLNSMYHISNNMPFHGGDVDLYGHYALFYWLPLKLFGSNALVIGICIGISGVIMCASLLGTINRLVKLPVLKIVAAICLMFILGSEKIYLQIFPHRIMFLSIILYLATRLKDKRISGYVVCILAMIWNHESGIVCGLVWASYITLKKLGNRADDMKFVAKIALLECIVVIFEELIAYVVVGVYNFCTNGFCIDKAFNIQQYLGVLTDRSYMVDFHMTPLEWGNSEWIYIMCFFIVSFMYALGKIGVAGNKPNINSEDESVIGAIAVAGIGLFTFSMNRTWAGWSQIRPLLIILQVVFVDRFIENYPKKKNVEMRQAIKAIMCVLTLLSISSYFVNGNTYMKYLVEDRIIAGTLNYSEVDADLKKFAEIVPRNTKATGDGLYYIYMNLGWDIQEEIDDAEYIVGATGLHGQGLQKDGVEVIRTIYVGKYPYYLYRKVEN